MAKRVAVLGAGAAGYFAAIQLAEGGAQVFLLEKTYKTLAKLRISGGGRCNVTHYCLDPKELVKHYPRGAKALLGPFTRFGPAETIAWFETRGVDLKVEADGRMFPTTDDSETIAQCLENSAYDAGVELMLGVGTATAQPIESGWLVQYEQGSLEVDAVVVATGGSPKMDAMQWLEELGHSIVPPVPSLFTFNLPEHKPLKELQGLSVPHVLLRVPAYGFQSQGPLLVTHWGLSGPAVLKASAWLARELHEVAYQQWFEINWLNVGPEPAKAWLVELRKEQAVKQIGNAQVPLPKRLWLYLLERAAVPEDLQIAQLTKIQTQQLLKTLTADAYRMAGKTTYKEEFVTAGGIALSDVNFKTMESKRCPSLYFCGEVLDIDGVTGGFNFQAAWTTGWGVMG